MDEIRRLRKLFGILGIIGGSFLVQACEDTTEKDAETEVTEDGDAQDADADAEPDTDLWDMVMCE
jgi:hypothetical protein